MKHLLIFFSLLFCCTGYAQTIWGTVIDADNNPIPVVTVSLKGKRLQVSTDEQGKFTLEVREQKPVLVFSGLNVQTSEMEVGDRTEITVVLKRRDNVLDEVQIVGYGTSTQRLNVGSVTKIKAEDIERQAVTNPLAALQGRVPGLDISSTSGLPGSAFTVQLRGQNTVNTSRVAAPPMDNPLFIIDGVPFAPQNDNINQFASLVSPGAGRMFNNANGGLSPFNSINPADIESIEILRDADATAIYGSRGGNGVILITTKKGRQGKTELTVGTNFGIGVVAKTMPMMNTEQYLEMRREAYANDGLVPSESASSNAYAPDVLLFDSNRDVDWQEEFFGTPSYNSVFNIGLSGGSQQTQFRFGANYNKATFSLPGGFYDQKAGVLLGIHHDTNDKKLSFDFSGTYNRGNNNSSSAANLLLAANLQPNYPDPFDEAGNLVWYYNGVSLNGSAASTNPYAYLLQEYAMNSNALNGNTLISYRPIAGLSIKTSLGISSFRTDEYRGFPRKSRTPEFAHVASANFGNSASSSWIIEPQAAYNRTFHKLEIEGLLGGTFQGNTNKGQSISTSGYISDELIRSISGAPNKNAGDNFSEYRYAALFGRLKINFDRRYLFSANFRRDGSSRFGPGRQFGNFGSVGLGWLFNEERIVKESLPFLSYGKLRTSYGVTGSDGIGNYNFMSRWESTYYEYGGILGYSPLNHFNDEFSWASTKKLEVGLELGFLDDRFLLTTAWYRNRTGNQLVNYTLPISTGFPRVVQNWGAEVENAGVEAVLQATIWKTPTFSWSSSFNISLPKNRLISFPGLAESAYSTMYTIGRSLNSLYLYRYAGVDPGTGLFTFYKEDGSVTSIPQAAQNGQFNDLYYAGNTDPVFFGGIMNSFSYRSLRLDVFMEFKKRTGENFLGQVYGYRPGGKSNMPIELLDRWRGEGDQTPYQQYSTVSSSPAGRATQIFVKSDAVYEDASYVRFRTVSVSYDFPADVNRRIGAERLSVFATAQNLFTITNYRGNDPETQSFYGVPPLRSYNFGLQIKF